MKSKSSYALMASFSAVILVAAYYWSCNAQENQPHVTVDWSKRVVRAKTDIALGQVLTADCLEEEILDTPIVSSDYIRSLSSAVDRKSKKFVKKGELLIYSSFGDQRYLIGRPHPENEIY